MVILLLLLSVQPHRVLIPDDEVKRKKMRQSIAIFLHPDHDTVIRCLDNSGKYPEITAYEDTHQRLVNTYDKSFNENSTIDQSQL